MLRTTLAIAAAITLAAEPAPGATLGPLSLDTPLPETTDPLIETLDGSLPPLPLVDPIADALPDLTAITDPILEPVAPLIETLDAQISDTLTDLPTLLPTQNAPSPVPLPAGLPLLLGALAGLTVIRRRKTTV